MSSYVLLLTPIAFFMITGFILGEAFDVDPVGDIFNNILCPFPDFNNGIDASIDECSAVDHPDSYADDTFVIVPQFTLWEFNATGGWFSGDAGWVWVATTPEIGLPNGIGNYIADVVWSILFRVTQVFLMIGAPFLILLPVLSILQAGGTDIFAFVAPIYMFMYVSLAVGLYKTLSPFVGE